MSNQPLPAASGDPAVLAPEVILAAWALINAMEECHECGSLVFVEEGPIYCGEGGCSSDCDDHEEPPCIGIDVLHGNLKRVLAKYESLAQGAPDGVAAAGKG